MDNKILSVLVLYVIGSVYSHPLFTCQNGPDYWCQNDKTAKECNVESFCKILKAEGMLPKKDDEQKKINDAPPVSFSLYYESLCPGCRGMMMSQIYPTYQALKGTGILKINLYPYGNADERQVGEKWEFTCQHGELECKLNLVETCAIHLLPAIDHLPFIHCLETKPTLKHGQVCARQLGVEWDPIMACVNGSMGNFLEHQMAVKTDALNPRHQYVPWVTVNGVHNDDIQDKVSDNMLRYVCSVYTGTPPPACNAVLYGGETRKRVEACYKENKGCIFDNFCILQDNNTNLNITLFLIIFLVCNYIC